MISLIWSSESASFLYCKSLCWATLAVMGDLKQLLLTQICVLLALYKRSGVWCGTLKLGILVVLQQKNEGTEAETVEEETTISLRIKWRLVLVPFSTLSKWKKKKHLLTYYRAAARFENIFLSEFELGLARFNNTCQLLVFLSFNYETVQNNYSFIHFYLVG